jgi:ABC-type transport system involved in multi-copper enzyme maturation permease subunit
LTSTEEETMDAAAPAKPIKINRFLPYWAVFQADLKQTLRSWVYRIWVFLSLGAALGYLLYRYGAEQVSGMVQPASELMSDMLNWIVLGSVTLIIVLTAGTICSERGTMADSVLSRGISRFQYFLGKWHARMIAILGTFFVMGLVILAGSLCLLHGENLSVVGTLVALLALAAILMVVITFGVTISAVVNTTLVSITIGWMLLNATGFVLSLLPVTYPAPDRIMKRLPDFIHGYYDLTAVGRLLMAAAILSVLTALAGMICFSRRDI